MDTTLRPRLTMTGPMLHGSGQLHIVGHDDVVSIPDPDGVVHRLLVLADGSRSTADLHAALAADHPRVDERDVRGAIRALSASGVLEDCGVASWPVRPTAIAR